MDTYSLILLGSGLNTEKLDQCYAEGLQKGFDVIADKLLKASKGDTSNKGGNCIQDSLLSMLECRHTYFAIACSQFLQDELQEPSYVQSKTSLDILNNSDWVSVDDKTLSQTQEALKILISRHSENSVLDQKELRVKEDSVVDDDDPDLNGDNGEVDDIADHVHRFADLLPTKGGVVITLYWILPDQKDLNTMNTLPLFGALKRLQHCNNAVITILTTKNILSGGFLDSWKKWLKFSPIILNDMLEVKDLPLWHGSLTCLGQQRNARIVLPGFTLTSSSNNQREIDMTPEESDHLSPKSASSAPCLSPEIQILKYIPRLSVPLYLFLPTKLQLHLEYKDENISQMFMEDLKRSCSKGLGLLACMSMTTKHEGQKEIRSLESWMDYVTSLDGSTLHQVSGFAHKPLSDINRLCMIYSKGPDDIIVYLFRQPSSLNGKIYEYLQSMTRGKEIVDSVTESTLQVQVLSNYFLDGEKKSPSLSGKELINHLEKCKESDVQEGSPHSRDSLRPRSKNLHLIKKIDIDLSRTIDHILYSDLSIPPCKWPERLWLTQNDPIELAAREAKKKAPTPIEKVLSMDGKDILKRFHSDGRPVREDLSPLRSAHKPESESHILINTTEENIRRTRYPEALTKKYHGVDYCLDSRGALLKDIQISHTQTSIVKQETRSTCTALNSKGLETLSRNVQRVTRTRNQDRSTGVTAPSGKHTRLKKRTSPPAKRSKRQTAKRKRAESPKQEESLDEEKVESTKIKETRSQRHKRRLRLVVEKTLSEHGIDKKNDLYASCTDRLYSLIKSFLKDLKSSHGLNDTMKDLARSNVEQVINFEKTRVRVK